MLSLVLSVYVSMEERVEMEETMTLTQSSLKEGPALTRAQCALAEKATQLNSTQDSRLLIIQ